MPRPSHNPSTDGAMEIDPELLSPGDASNEFNHITGSFARQTGEDDDDGDGQMPSVISIEIAKLFNFTNKSWIPSHEHSTS
jgi:hypothetical protein